VRHNPHLVQSLAARSEFATTGMAEVGSRAPNLTTNGTSCVTLAPGDCLTRYSPKADAEPVRQSASSKA
jgi:hypothetical protein